MKKEAQKEDSPISQIKYSFEVNILPVKSTEFIIKKPLFFVNTTKIVSINHNFTLEKKKKNGLQPPEILG